ncbi:MAG: hypothetical protein IPG22_20785 [Acidobacteria bacterium]|nr:hypothetical protein [Acidobacteriota bacterium]
MIDLSDEQLVELAVSENPDAFGEIVRRWERKIFGLCFGMLGREDDASDACQEAFIAAYRNIGNFRGESKSFLLAAPHRGKPVFDNKTATKNTG